jgi:hypothetical protein
VTTTHTEPESLDAWARRIAPTLTDQCWRRVNFIASTGTRVCDGLHYAPGQARALLAELDRLLGELSIAAMRALTDGRGIAGARRLEKLGLASVVFPELNGRMIQKLSPCGRFGAGHVWRLVRNPLGRACLARAGQRQSGEKSGPSGQRKEGP